MLDHAAFGICRHGLDAMEMALSACPDAAWPQAYDLATEIREGLGAGVDPSEFLESIGVEWPLVSAAIRDAYDLESATPARASARAE